MRPENVINSVINKPQKHTTSLDEIKEKFGS